MSKKIINSPKSLLPVTRFLVLALLAEEEAHGYQLEQLIQNRGFRYWTDIGRTSIYQALKKLEEEGLVTSKLMSGGGPARKVYKLTKLGLDRLTDDAVEHIRFPSHPRSKIDLGIYALPFISKKKSLGALEECRKHLKERLAFLEERFAWCTKGKLRLAALNFQRPLLALKAELVWLDDLILYYSDEDSPQLLPDWRNYYYKEPPNTDILLSKLVQKDD